MRVKPLVRATARLALLLVLVSVVANPQEVRQAPSVEPQWSPIVDLDNELFPAAILALATRRGETNPPTYLGDPNGMLGIKITASTPGTRLRVSVKVDRLIDESSIEVVIPQANREYRVFPQMRFDGQALARVQQAFPATASFSVSFDEGKPDEQIRTVRVRSVNDVPYLHRTSDGHTLDPSSLFAAFVNEGHPWIDGVLSEALQANAIGQFIGYQGTPQDVVHQVFAVWNVLQRRSVKYSSITRPSGQSQSVISQHVRFLDETIRYSQANCVDGTVLFASVLYKLDLSPVLVLMPGHMFLGFYVSRESSGQQRDWMFLETTAIGSPGLNSAQRGWKFLTREGYRDSESYRQFLFALNRGNQQFDSIVANLNAKQPGYRIIDIAEARRSGIAAIPRF